MMDADVAGFCTGSVIGTPGYSSLSSTKPCSKLAARVLVTAPGTVGGLIAYLCPSHQFEARSAGWQVQAEPRKANPYAH